MGEKKVFLKPLKCEYLRQTCVFDSKVPLVIFKREKDVARRLEFDGLYVTQQPPEEDIKGQWDRLVINTPYVHVFICQRQITI